MINTIPKEYHAEITCHNTRCFVWLSYTGRQMSGFFLIWWRTLVNRDKTHCLLGEKKYIVGLWKTRALILTIPRQYTLFFLISRVPEILPRRIKYLWESHCQLCTRTKWLTVCEIKRYKVVMAQPQSYPIPLTCDVLLIMLYIGWLNLGW